MTDPDAELLEWLGSVAHDPYAFVMGAFPWGEPNTELAGHSGPSPWQVALLCEIRDGLRTPGEAILTATTSGHGVGKSAFVGWIVWWAFSTRENTRGVVTANTENQLRTKTWVEIAKWHRLFIAKHFFKCTATALFSIDEDVKREWRIDVVPWSERNTEAFAGLHNAGNRILIIYDEASAIPDVIWETTEGALTDEDTEIIWCVFGNPTRTSGRFRECFEGGQFAHRWHQHKVDSRSVPITNKDQLNRWIDDYGLDSDFVRVRILGEFPSEDSDSFISRELATAAVHRTIESQAHAPLVLGVDPARYGADFAAIVGRRGRDWFPFPPRFLPKCSIPALCAAVGQMAGQHNPDMIFVDGGGVGGGAVDLLISQGFPVIEVNFSERPVGLEDGVKYRNRRSEIWGQLRLALPGASIPGPISGYERTPVEDLIGPQYTVTDKGEIALESKELMRRRGVPSPDWADAMALTYALPVAKRPAFPRRDKPDDYNPYEEFLLHEA